MGGGGSRLWWWCGGMATLRPPTRSERAAPPAMSRRRCALCRCDSVLFQRVALMWLLLKVLAAITVYGTAIEPRFVVRENEAASIPQLSTAWEGKQIVVFADLQVGMWWSNRDAARRLLRQLVDINPPPLLFAGDLLTAS